MRIYQLDTTARSVNLDQNWTFLSKCFTKSFHKGVLIILVESWANSSSTLVILENGNALNESFIEFRVESKPTNFLGTGEKLLIVHYLECQRPIKNN